MSDLSPCPFCGGEASIEQYGNPRQSTIYQCNNCSCRLETGEEWEHGKGWNTRHEDEAAPTNEADIRNAALEAAATLIEEGFDRGIKTKVDMCAHGKFQWEDCDRCAAAAIRSLKSDAPPAPEPKPFTFADPAAQLQHERLRTRKAEER